MFVNVYGNDARRFEPWGPAHRVRLVHAPAQERQAWRPAVAPVQPGPLRIGVSFLGTALLRRAVPRAAHPRGLALFRGFGGPSLADRGRKASPHPGGHSQHRRSGLYDRPQRQARPVLQDVDLDLARAARPFGGAAKKGRLFALFAGAGPDPPPDATAYAMPCGGG